MVSAPHSFFRLSIPHHLPDLLIVLRRRMPVHPSSSGDGTQVGLPGMEPLVLPNLLLLLGEFLRRGDSPDLIQEELPLRLHLPDQRIQLLLAPARVLA